MKAETPTRVAITGASGLIGAALASYLTAGGHDVLRLVRRRPDPAAVELRWDPTTAEIDAAALEGVDAVVHLAGANIGDKRWSDSRKRLIMDSRVLGTRLISETIARLESPPRVLVSASGVGYYGDQGDRWLTEESALGDGFLAEVCDAWERETRPARDAGIRVVNARLGVVLSAQGGALDKLVKIFRFGVGGKIGAGAQSMSWLAHEDAIGALHHCIVTETLSGPVNLVTPNPVTNKTFTKTLGRVIKRPTFVPVPRFAVRALYGEMGRETVLAGQRVAPTRLVATGFEFAYPELEAALRHELGR